MNIYNLSVTAEESNRAESFGTRDFALIAKALGMLLSLGVSLRDAISAVAAVTPNAKLRRILVGAWLFTCADMNFGRSMEISMKACGAWVDDKKMPKFFYEEDCMKLAEQLLAFAKDRGLKGGELAQMIDRSQSVVNFTAKVHDSLSADVDIDDALKAGLEVVGPVEQIILNEIVNRVEAGITSLSEEFIELPRIFDPLYVKAIETGENSGQLAKAFELLATC